MFLGEEVPTFSRILVASSSGRRGEKKIIKQASVYLYSVL